MNSQELRALQEAYHQVYELDENRMASRMEKMPSPPAKPTGGKTHSIKDLTPSKPPTPEEKAKARNALGIGEEIDLYDVILSHLLDEGYAETPEAAEAIMVNMSEDWRESIVEGIADRAANAVGHQRAGTLGDDDEIRKNQDATSASIGKMRRGSGAKVTPTLPGV